MSGNDIPDGISAAVLAGGKSSRMGTDKALVPLAPGGPAMLELVLGVLRPVASDLVIVASDRPAYGRFGVPVVPDRFSGAGVLGGIATALSYAQHDRCLVVACDMPLINPELLRFLVGIDPAADAVVPRTRARSRQGGDVTFQPLHAVYHRRCLPAIERALSGRRLSAIAFLADVHVRFVGELVLRAIDPELRSLMSVDTPERLAEVRALLQASHD
ncbi:MAG: molybdenum cofactor guanylyltransferase [Chloroflexota bacterium]